MNSIMIIEDEEDLLSTLQYNLENEGYKTHAFHTGEEGLEWAIHHGPPGLALLDIMLPGISGIEVCSQLRANERTRTTPVVFLSAKGDDIDRVIGFELGADDYISKPFNVRELLLRIRAILRRSQKLIEQDKSPIIFGTLTIDHKKHQVWVAGKKVDLTALEFKLLVILHARKGWVQSREALLGEVWNNTTPTQTRTVDVHVKRLREKLGTAGNTIETIRGVGYRFQETA